MLFLGAFAVHADAQRVVLSRAQVFGAPSHGWQAAIGGGGVGPLAAVLEARALTPHAFGSLSPEARGALLSNARLEAAQAVRAEAKAAIAASPSSGQAAVFDQALRLSTLSGRLSSYLDDESVRAVERTRGVVLSGMSESARTRLRERIEAETSEWSAREAGGVPAVRAGEGRAAKISRLGRPMRAALEAGGLSVPDWIKMERLRFSSSARGSGDYLFVILHDGARFTAMFMRPGAKSKDGPSVRFIRRTRPPMGPEEHVDVLITRANAAGAAKLLEMAWKKSPVEGPQGADVEEMLRFLRELAGTPGK